MSGSPAQPNSAANFYCSKSAQHAGEELWGSAPQVDVWLLLEYAGPWGRKAVDENNLPQRVKDRLAEFLATFPGSRLQFVKRHEPTDRISFFVALSQEHRSVLYEFKLTAYEDLFTLDVPALVSAEASSGRHVRNEPLFLVCTNGKRDRCCARFGFPVYQAMADYAGDSVWQTTHIGGHRFAPTAVFLPHGVCYGRIAGSDVKTLVDAYQVGRVDLQRYRGRSCYSHYVQAADHFLRVETGITDLAHYRLCTAQALNAEQWRVELAAPDGTVNSLRIQRERSTIARAESCSANLPTELEQFRLIDYQIRSETR